MWKSSVHMGFKQTFIASFSLNRLHGNDGRVNSEHYLVEDKRWNAFLIWAVCDKLVVTITTYVGQQFGRY